MRLICRLLGCNWKKEYRLKEADPRWDRNRWRCQRCLDLKDVWVRYNQTGKPDRFYK